MHENHKECRYCFKIKDLVEFPESKHSGGYGKRGKKIYCKECNCEREKAKLENKFRCNTCLIYKDLNCFYKFGKHLYFKCKDCIYEERKHPKLIQNKQCKICKEIKSVTQFARYLNISKSNKKGTLKKVCQSCEDNKHNLLKNNLRECKLCKKIKNLKEFYICTGYRKYRCKECLKKTDNINKSNWRQKNPEKRILGRIKHQAKKQNIEFNIDESDIIIPEYCPILGIKLEYNVGRECSGDYSPSLDKLIPKLGYIKGNVKVISNRANRIKSDGTAEEHEKIAKWMKEQGCN